MSRQSHRKKVNKQIFLLSSSLTKLTLIDTDKYCHKSGPWPSIRLPPEVALPLY